MSKIGVNLSIDVKSIDRARMVNHRNGKTYLNMTVFIDPSNPGQYGDHGMITQDVSKQEKEQGVKGPILGNCKVFWRDDAVQIQDQGVQQVNNVMQQPRQQKQAPPHNFDDDLGTPF